ncbi:MAG: hypothetical protein J6Y02_11830 [Pseudobutyrivibrio sp.]|nr:hypothetical protein [Pseudobutyrivibrio sp.]
MTRYFCDRCKKEISTPIKITIEGSEEGYEVCTHCLIQISEFIEKYEEVEDGLGDK